MSEAFDAWFKSETNQSYKQWLNQQGASHGPSPREIWNAAITSALHEIWWLDQEDFEVSEEKLNALKVKDG